MDVIRWRTWPVARPRGWSPGGPLVPSVGLHMGATEEGWARTRPERSLMILGPPPDTGKTTGVLVPLVLSTYGPVVAASTKDDVFAASGMVRALQGTLWHFRPGRHRAHPRGLPAAAPVAGIGRGRLGPNGDHRRGDDPPPIAPGLGLDFARGASVHPGRLGAGPLLHAACWTAGTCAP